MKKKVLRVGKLVLARSILIGLFIVSLTLVIAYARGYRLSLLQQKVVPTGILVASSYPNGAKIYVNGELKGATNSNITLPPGVYKVEIRKDGYSSWEKEVTIRGELVLKADALLYPQNPSLSPATNLGIARAWFFPQASLSLILATQRDTPNATPSPTTTAPDQEEPEREGVFLLDSASSLLRVSSPLQLLVPKSALPSDLDPATLEAELSPDGDQILLKLKDATGRARISYLIQTSGPNDNLFNVTAATTTITTAWQQQMATIRQKQIEALQKPLASVARSGFDIIAFSPDKEKILYTAAKNVTIPLIINPPLIATNQTPQQRSIQKRMIYVYDIKEDKNYQLPEGDLVDKLKPPQVTNLYLWYPDSQHVVMREAAKISVVDYDGTHKHTVYSGPFDKNYLGVSGDYKLLVLANLNPQTNNLPDLYSVGIR